MNTKKSYSTNNTYSIISYDEYVGISSTSKQFISISNCVCVMTYVPSSINIVILGSVTEISS